MSRSFRHTPISAGRHSSDREYKKLARGYIRTRVRGLLAAEKWEEAEVDPKFGTNNIRGWRSSDYHYYQFEKCRHMYPYCLNHHHSKWYLGKTSCEMHSFYYKRMLRK